MWIVVIALAVIVAAVFLWKRWPQTGPRFLSRGAGSQPDTHPTPPREKL